MAQISPIQTPQYQPLQQPNYNAVKIDINNPQVNTTPQTSQIQPIQPQQAPGVTPVYNSIPAASVYEIPQQSIYNPQAVSQPAAVQETVSVPPPVIIQPSIKQIPSTPQIPVATATETAPKKVEVKTPEAAKPQLDLNEFITKLTSKDYEIQAKAIESIAQIAQKAPEKATDLLDVKIVNALLGIMSTDTSKLEGPTPQQLQIREKIMSGKKVSEAENAEANKITPMELAERNKLFSIYTVAMLEKLYSSEIEKIDKTVVPMTELPGAAGIVEQIKNNPNPMVRIAGIDALSFIQRPEYKQDLATLFSVAKNDKDPNVQKVADLALKKLEQLPAPAPQKQ